MAELERSCQGCFDESTWRFLQFLQRVKVSCRVEKPWVRFVAGRASTAAPRSVLSRRLKLVRKLYAARTCLEKGLEFIPCVVTQPVQFTLYDQRYVESAAINAASQLLQASVCTGSGDVIGHVDDLLLNPATGKVDYLMVRPIVGKGSLCVRLAWKDVKVDSFAERVVIVPGGTAVKRLLIRISLSNKQDAVH